MASIPNAGLARHSKGFLFNYLKIFFKNILKADQSEFHKCWCAILPLNHARSDRVEYGFLFTARKAPCDSSPVFERPLIGFHLNQSKPQNSREWLLKLQKDKLNIMLDDKDTRDDWVNAIRSAIKSKF